MNTADEIFSFHLVRTPFWKVPRLQNISGLHHSESFFTMNLGEMIVSPLRYNFKTVATFAWWKDEKALEDFLSHSDYKLFNDGWHVRMKLYRRWGEINALRNAVINPELAPVDGPVVAVTLARLKLSETLRFTKWGKPVESQVRHHKGNTLSLAAFRPLNTFSTFSIWKNEAEMINMVQGLNKQDGSDHKLAMQERNRKDFHHEFSTMRFLPLREIGEWNGKSGYLSI